MFVAAGSCLGPYEIQALVGKGGMGEVYRARDTRLNRTVAVKVLPAELAIDPERNARFAREAQAIAALNHPHICTVHDVGDQGGRTFLVMEHLEGQSLAARLRRGPLPVPQALEIGAQIADALAAAHKAGIVHRDLKPANVMLVGDSGTLPRTGAAVSVKLLDFGLAKLTGHGEDPAATLARTAVVPASLTGPGTIIGTLPYMAPEQVQGQEADTRTDIWALGAILYEMVTGSRAFEASSAISLIGAILEREPASLTARQPLTPRGLERVVRRCLAKHPDDRWDSARDVADELRWIAEAATQTSVVAGLRTPWQRTALRVVLPTAIVAGVVAGVAVWHVRPSSPAPIVRTQLNVDPAANVDSGGFWNRGWTRGGSRTAVMWASNGRALVFIGSRAGTRQIYVRDLEQSEARGLAGTEGTGIAAVSPDGQFVVFWANGEFRRVPLDGGPAQTLWPERLPPGGMAIGGGGRVVFNRELGGIWGFTANSPPTAVTSLAKGETAHVLPQLLSQDGVLLFTVRTSRSWGHERVVAQVLATGERKVLLRDAVDARYLPSGHLVFLRRGLLMAVPFDVTRLTVTGPPVGVLDSVAQSLVEGSSGDATGGGQFSVSSSGALGYISSPVVAYPKAALAMVDRRGHVSTLPVEVRSYGPLRLSPDGRQLAVTIFSVTEQALAVIDLTRASFTKLTVEAEFSRWTPDGQRIAFNYTRDGVPQLAWQPADGSAGPDTLVKSAEGDIVPSSWSPDGRHLAVVKDRDLWLLTVGDPPRFTPLTATPEEEKDPEFSPDGRSLAYTSNKTGRWEVYVRPYPATGPSVPVSTAGGGNPAWNPRGGELFFLSERTADSPTQMMTVAIVDHQPGTPRRLFQSPFGGCAPVRCYDVTPDGQRFVALNELPRDPPPPVTHINVVLNWVGELNAKAPAK